MSKASSDLDESYGHVPERQTRWLLIKQIAHIFTDPFQGDPEQYIAQTPFQRGIRRRAAVLRLILVSITVLSVVVVIPSALILQASFMLMLTLVVNLALSIFYLVLVADRRPTLAATLFIATSILLAVAFVFAGAAGSNALSLLALSALLLLILAAGVVLPSWAVWPTTAVTIIATLFCTMFSSSIWDPANPADNHIRLTAAAILSAFQVLTAVIAYVAARSANAGEVAASRAFERERELAALKDQFIIDANHELRTPIMALYGNIEMLSLMGERVTDELRDRFVGRALSSGDSVLRLLTSVLDASIMESGAPRLTLQPLLLAPVVRAILETFDPREIGEPGLEDNSYESRPVTMAIPPDLTVFADEGRLRQILINLLSNALKYSQPGTAIEISAKLVPPRQRLLRRRGKHEAATEESLYAQISVRDYGLGVPPRDAPKLFNRFVRLERDITGPVRGTGVGLYLCRMLTEAMGGRISVESSGIPGQGSTFTFTLPLPLAGDSAPMEALPLSHSVPG